MADSPVKNADGPLGVTVKLNGTALADTVGVVSIRVETELNRVPEAVVTLADGSVAEQEFPLTDADTAKPGSEIEISAQFGSNTAQTLFTGIVTGLRLRIRSGSGGQLELSCRDKAVKLTGLCRTAVWSKTKDSDAMSALVQAAGLTADIAATDGPEADLVQHDCPDWDFLRLLADRNGLVLAVDAGKITAAAPDPSAAAKLTLTLGDDVLDFDARLDTVGLEKTVSVTGWDPAQQTATVQTSDAVAAGAWGSSALSDLTGVTGDRTRSQTASYAEGQVSLTSVAKARAARVALAALQGRCSYPGSAAARPGDTVEIKGVGDRMGGTAYVAGITHELGDGHWTTTARLGLPQGWRSDGIGPGGAAAGGLVAPVPGLQPATVVALTDSGSENPLSDSAMIKVSLPLSGDPPVEIWARYAQPYGSNGAGIQFLPEVGDEVVLGFFADDPAAPVILGSLHGGKLARTREATDGNDIKALTTRSGLEISFDDDKTVLTAKTPGGHSIVLSDDDTSVTVTDSTGNSIKMESSGVTVSSKGTLDLTAEGNITISSSGGDVSVSGTNVTLSGDMGLTAKGGTSAELSAGGQTTVKGAMVMIN
ncbi:phage baseplate assembly protein V [Rhodovulum visakhapatnamense]|uniref:Rhs element Vgr protein n=1 Tax=Rhodovulum visakhapatnamense TaxID=364297 RepID=A0A4R8G0B5_9RHOB|nr:phage baseplate assembly protein V [Rhodovulum visakhapatnamense]TDX32506.1 Rhs element Vgr protein [Rhodovulum visakhapatnamense]